MIPESAPYPSQPVPPGPTAPQKLPGRVGIWIGVALVLAGVIVGVLLVITGARSFAERVGDLQRVPIRGGGTVLLEETGSQNVYLERPATTSGGGFSVGGMTTVPYVEVTVRDPEGNPLYLDVNPDTTETYTLEGREGFLLGRFDATVPGQYRIDVVAGDDLGSYTTVAVGEAFDLSSILQVVGGVVGGGLLVLLGIVVIIISAIRRSRARKRQQQAAYGYPGPGGSGGPPGWAPPPVAGVGASTWSPPPGPAWNPPPGQAPTPPPATGWQPPPPAAPPVWTPPAGSAPPPPADSVPPPWTPPADSPAPADAPPPADAPAPADAPPPGEAPPRDGQGPVQ
jgi:hypothetical protein